MELLVPAIILISVFVVCHFEHESRNEGNLRKVLLLMAKFMHINVT